MLAIAALKQNQPHPDLVRHFSALLRSINDRLSGGEGQDVAPLIDHWAGDCLRFILKDDDE